MSKAFLRSALGGFAQKVCTQPAPFETAPEKTGPPQGERWKYVADAPPTARPEEPPSSGGVSKGARWTFLGKAALGSTLMLMVVGGCNSCQESPELPAPLPKEGRLPPAPQPVVTQGTIAIPPPSCAVVASSSVEEGDAPLEVHFTAEGMCTDADGKFTWDFGDGSETTQAQNPIHVYTKPGTYNAQVTIDDPEHDAKDSDESPITVNAK